MAAGLGFKDFTTGEVLTAADVDGYLMQGIWVFANSTARDAAVTSPQEGNFAFLKDTNTTTYYTGSAWTNLDTTGMVNPMTTTGDTIYASSGSTPARLGIGSTGQVLTVAGGVPSWAAATSGGMTLISTTTLSGATVSISSIPSTYKELKLVVTEYKPATSASALRIRVNGDSNANRHAFSATPSGNNNGDTATFDQTSFLASYTPNSTTANGISVIQFFDYTNTSIWKYGTLTTVVNDNTTSTSFRLYNGTFIYNQTSAISSLDLFPSSGNFTSGTAKLYGVS